MARNIRDWPAFTLQTGPKARKSEFFFCTTTKIVWFGLGMSAISHCNVRGRFEEDNLGWNIQVAHIMLTRARE